MATNTNFNRETTAQEVVDAFGDEIRGKTVVVTGPSLGGIGAETARTIASKAPKLLILAGRDMAKLEATQAAILSETPGAALALVKLDLSSLASVRSAAADITAALGGTGLDVLLNNAAVMMCPYGTTTDGLETQFGTNYVGPWLLTNLLLPSLLAAPAPRVVFVSSVGHRVSPIHWDDIGFSAGKTYNNIVAYGQSKTASILNAVALAARHKLTAISLHPGAIQTNLSRHISEEDMKGLVSQFFNEDGTPKEGTFFKSIPQGASTSLVAAFDPALKGHSGAYLADCQVARVRETGEDLVANLAAPETVAPYALDKGAAERLWALTEEMVGQKFA